MNLALRILLIATLTTVSQQVLPWWSSLLVAFLVELFLGKEKATTFFSGFYGVAIPWMLLAAYIDHMSESILSVQILKLFNAPPYGFVMIIITGFLGGLYGGLASVVGGWTRLAFMKND